MVLNKIALVALSNPIKSTENIEKLLNILKGLNIKVITSRFLTNNLDILNRDNKGMATELIEFLNDSTLQGVFDISGGDLSNLILPYIDFNSITNDSANFFGYSDLTTLLNAFLLKSNINVFNYQILNIIKNSDALNLFIDTFKDNNFNLYTLDYHLINICTSSINGIAIGGNIRCFLKLAGTPYMPNLKDKILFLESYSGDSFKMLTFINQLITLKDFDSIKAIVLGNFTELDSFNSSTIENLFQKFINKPIFRTSQLGHHETSKCLPLGKALTL